jgi:uncharacterized membrane protein YidH (DUF202 family)
MASFTLKKLREFFPRTVTPDQSKDTGMAMVLIGLILALITGRKLYMGLAAVLLLIDMVRPGVYRPLAKIWYGLARLLGAFMSRIMFGLVYFIMVVPIGLVRKLMGKDALQMKKWKTGRESVLRVRDHQYTATDVAHPY